MNYYFITGTSKGLGKSIAEKILSEDNAKVFGIGRTSSIINPNYTHFYLDLSLVCELESKLSSVFKSLIKPEKIILINNSGILGDIKYVGENSAKSIIEVFNINTIAPAILMNSFIKQYSRSNCSKSIINISSGAGKNPLDGWSSYCSSKSGLDMYSKVINEEQNIRQSNIKIFSVSPGIIDTEMQAEIRKSDAKNFNSIQKFKDYKVDNKLSSSAHVANKFWYLLQNENYFNEIIQDVRNF